eukprot:2517010-Alexandrium_andersonii.AAC.1
MFAPARTGPQNGRIEDARACVQRWHLIIGNAAAAEAATASRSSMQLLAAAAQLTKFDCRVR